VKFRSYIVGYGLIMVQADLFFSIGISLQPQYGDVATYSYNT